jgi:hypothetical protein
MPKIKLLDNLIIGDGKTLVAGTVCDTEQHGIDADGLDNLLTWKAIEVVGDSDPIPANLKDRKAPKPDPAIDPALAVSATDPAQAAI